MKKVLAIVLSLVIVFCVTISVGAVPAPHLYGDVNNDNSVDILDATEVQRYLAQVSEFSKLSLDLGNVDADGNVTILDATMIQRKLAGLISVFPHSHEGLFTYIDINNVTANFDSGIAMAGVPVAFNVEAYCPDASPLRYQYEIFEAGNDVPVCVSEVADESVFTYTFEKATEYFVCIKVHNKYDEIEQYELDYQVIEKTDDALRVSAVNRNKIYLNEYEEIIVTADAFGGTQPYEYSFVLKGTDLKQDYSVNNSFKIGTLPINEYTVTVTVKDADGNTASRDYSFFVEDILVG